MVLIIPALYRRRWRPTRPSLAIERIERGEKSCLRAKGGYSERARQRRKGMAG